MFFFNFFPIFLGGEIFQEIVPECIGIAHGFRKSKNDSGNGIRANSGYFLSSITSKSASTTLESFEALPADSEDSPSGELPWDEHPPPKSAAF